MSITLKQLRYFDAVARHGHFGRAAEASAISQPALSMQIKELEEGLGTVLIERGARRVQLTAFGEACLPRVRDILRGVDELSDLAQAAGPVGRLRLGVIPTIAPYLLPSIITALEAAHPGLELRVRETLTPRLIDELSEGRLDAAILALPSGGSRLAEVPLFDEAFLLVRPDAEASQPVPEAEGLPPERLLLLEEGHCLRDQALSFCSLPAARPREMLDGSSLSTLVQMVGAGLGVTVLPEMAVPVEARSAEVAVARFPAPEPTRTVGLVWRQSSPLAEQLVTVADVVRSAADALRQKTLVLHG